MLFLRFVLAAVVFTSAPSSFAFSTGLLDRLALMLATRHESGRKFCKRVQGTKFELSKRIEVPAKYTTPNAGRTEIYAWTYDPFDANKPSILFFEGGPGASSRGNHIGLENFNFIYFDQRGIGCSAPEEKRLHKDAEFYFSSYTARDADEVRKSYGIEKWTVYGSSYGTVPATIYANLFPQNTQAVILEGTIYAANDQYWRSDASRRIAQKVYDNLSDLDKMTVAKMIKKDPYAFSDIVNQLMYMDDMEENLKLILSMIRNGQDMGDDSGEDSDDMYISIQAFRMINCKEFDMIHAPSVAMVMNKDNQLVFDNNKKMSPSGLCKGTKVDDKMAKRHQYFSYKYPVSVPITYFQGARDGATPGGDAVRHYRKTAKGPKQILIMPNGGHGPNFYRIAQSLDLRTGQRKWVDSSMDLDLIQIQRQIYTMAAMGLPIDPALIAQFNAKSKNPWAYAGKF